MAHYPMSAAVAEMLAQDAADGVDVFDGAEPIQLTGDAAYETSTPLTRYVPPPPNWREEESAREAPSRPRDRLESEASLNPTPAKKAKRPPRTPNLDTVKAWRPGP